MESDGLWYVSPIGTLGASLVDLVRSVPDDANLIDTPLAPFLFQGMGRQAIDSSLAGITNIPPVCAAVLAVGADGVAAVVADPPVGEIRACVDALFEFGVATGSGRSSPRRSAQTSSSMSPPRRHPRRRRRRWCPPAADPD